MKNTFPSASPGHFFEQTPRDNGGQRSLVCCSAWGRQELHTNLETEQQCLTYY